jgi:hypothetical protein
MTKSIKILVGAGASYGAGSILPERPPLGNQLFLELQRIYPRTWGTIIGDLGDIFHDNFELGMKNIWDNFSHSISLLMQDMSEYFIQFRPLNNASLYCKLINDLKLKGILNSVSFTSLNYDIILELSLFANGYSVNYFQQGSEEPNEVEVLKIHGSSNFIGTGIEGGKGISYSSGAVFNGGIKASFDSSEVIENFLVKSGIAPVMSLYMEGKPVNVSPQILKDLQNTYQSRCSKAKTILIIGVKPIVEDKHIWDCMKESSANVYYVGSNTDFELFKELGISANHLGEYFNTSFKKITNVIYETN